MDIEKLKRDLDRDIAGLRVELDRLKEEISFCVEHNFPLEAADRQKRFDSKRELLNRLMGYGRCLEDEDD